MSISAERLFALIELLRGQRQQTTAELASQLEVSPRTVRRDLARLGALEVGVDVVPGRGGGVSLTHGALLPALRFTDDEALVLALGLRRAQAGMDPKLAKAAESAFKRLEHVLSERLGERVEALLETLTAEPVTTSLMGTLESGVLLDVAEAVRKRNRLEVQYRSRNHQPSRRLLDPYGVVQVDERWYTVGYCHLRQSVRTFRLDRLVVQHVMDEHFEVPEGFDPLETVSQSLAQAPFPGSLTCRVWLETTLEDAMKRIPAHAATLESGESGVLLSLRSRPENLEDFALHLLRLPFGVRVLEPLELQTMFKTLSMRALLASGILGNPSRQV